jgi:hypothetical protein
MSVLHTYIYIVLFDIVRFNHAFFLVEDLIMLRKVYNFVVVSFIKGLILKLALGL